MRIKPIYEFILWDNCCNNCTFCWQNKYGTILNDKQKLQSLTETYKFLTSKEFISGSHILVVGGELFDIGSNKIKTELIQFFKDIINMMTNNHIDLLYLNTNLLNLNFELLTEILNYIEINNLFPRLKFTTSYDVSGRFTTNENEWRANLEMLLFTYPEINIVINTILTEPCCYDILSNTSSKVIDIITKYKCKINLLPFINTNETLLPNPNLIFKSLQKIETIVPGYLTDYIHSIALLQDKYVYKYNDNKLSLEQTNCDDLECGHSENFTKYSKRNTCYICDLKEVFNGFC